MRSLLLALAVCTALLLPGSAARADYAFQFDLNGTPQNAFTVGVGQTVNVQVYLVQDNAGTSNGLSSQGLSSAGVQLNTANPAITTVTAVTGNSGFDLQNNTPGASAKVSESILLNNPVFPATGDPNRILIGTFTFTGLTAGSTVTVSALPGSGGDNTLGDGTNIDSFISTSSAAITVQAVPEPGAMILSGMAVAGFVAGVVRRRFRRKAEDTQPHAEASGAA